MTRLKKKKKKKNFFPQWSSLHSTITTILCCVTLSNHPRISLSNPSNMSGDMPSEREFLSLLNNSLYMRGVAQRVLSTSFIHGSDPLVPIDRLYIINRLEAAYPDQYGRLYYRQVAMVSTMRIPPFTNPDAVVPRHGKYRAFIFEDGEVVQLPVRIDTSNGRFFCWLYAHSRRRTFTLHQIYGTCSDPSYNCIYPGFICFEYVRPWFGIPGLASVVAWVPVCRMPEISWWGWLILEEIFCKGDFAFMQVTVQESMWPWLWYWMCLFVLKFWSEVSWFELFRVALLMDLMVSCIDRHVFSIILEVYVSLLEYIDNSKWFSFTTISWWYIYIFFFFFFFRCTYHPHVVNVLSG